MSAGGPEAISLPEGHSGGPFQRTFALAALPTL